MIEPEQAELTGHEKEYLRATMQSLVIRAAIGEALFRIQAESDNILRSSSLCDPKGIENAQRAQGRNNGALRLIEILFEIGAEDAQD